jgi:5-methylcytosine-specific restriction enzyme subunit McrC
MRNTLPTIRIREWSSHAPSSSDTGRVLRGLTLTDADKALLNELQGRSSINFVELKDGLSFSVGPHIGTITLGGVRVVIMPKIRIENLMRMVAFAFDLSDLTITETRTDFSSAEQGLIDLLGLSLLRSVERLVRGGLLPDYRAKSEDLATPRGRLDLGYIATHPRSSTLRCTFDEFTIDHDINQILAAGVRLAAGIMDSADLRLELARSADRFFGDLTRIELNAELIRSYLENLNRRSSHYRTALTLVALIQQGARLGEHTETGEMPLSSFVLNMNLVFERFLERYLKQNAPEDILIAEQDTRSDVFNYLENPGGWKQPMIRPDFVFRRRNKIVAVADAKYKNRLENPPSSAELYQLTTYGLSYPFAGRREVLMFHPLGTGQADRECLLQFNPSHSVEIVQLRLIGVPIDGILDGTIERWWPLSTHLRQQTFVHDSNSELLAPIERSAKGPLRSGADWRL